MPGLPKISLYKSPFLDLRLCSTKVWRGEKRGTRVNVGRRIIEVKRVEVQWGKSDPATTPDLGVQPNS